MALMIEDPEVERLARELAETTGKPVKAVLHAALRRELAWEYKQRGERSVQEIIREIQERVGKLPVLDDRSPDEIIGYNESGHFD